MRAGPLVTPGEPSIAPPAVVADEDALHEATDAAARARRVCVDLEASGLFTYRARPCTMQLAWDTGARSVVIDLLAVSVEGTRDLLGERGPIKVVHDLAFDARLLAESGVEIANVHDTAIAARMLGRTATGLASLLEEELGVRIEKELQHHDWRLRPFDAAGLAYLAADVAYLEELDRLLWEQVLALGIEQEVLEETRYRIASALEAVRTPPEEPPYRRLKGIERLTERELAVLRVVAELREEEAARRDVPPHRVASHEALVAIARGRPRTEEEVARVRGVATATPAEQAFAAELVRAVASAGEVLPETERARLAQPPPPPAVVRARREREGRLLAWRRAEAKRRGVDAQVVLPGHCVRDAARNEVPDVDALASVPGIGAFRVQRDGPAIVRALCGEGDPG
jgi:ribonuclease D